MHASRPLILPVLALLLAGCTSTVPVSGPADPASRIAAECRLLDAAATVMVSRGVPVHAGLTEGCPGVTARDTRPLAEQSRGLRAANTAPLPVAVRPGTRAEAVFRRLITRGVPLAVAVELTSGAVFASAFR